MSTRHATFRYLFRNNPILELFLYGLSAICMVQVLRLFHNAPMENMLWFVGFLALCIAGTFAISRSLSTMWIVEKVSGIGLNRTVHRLFHPIALLAISVFLTSGCATANHGHKKEVGEGEAYGKDIALEGGRTVHVYAKGGEGLFVQVRFAHQTSWSRPRVVFKEAMDPCPNQIDLKASKNTVAGIASFAPYCADGESPQRGIAFVSHGDLKIWEHRKAGKTTLWDSFNVSKSGTRAHWEHANNLTDYSMEWSLNKGLSKTAKEQREITNATVFCRTFTYLEPQTACPMDKLLLWCRTKPQSTYSGNQCDWLLPLRRAYMKKHHQTN